MANAHLLAIEDGEIIIQYTISSIPGSKDNERLKESYIMKLLSHILDRYTYNFVKFMGKIKLLYMSKFNMKLFVEI